MHSWPRPVIPTIDDEIAGGIDIAMFDSAAGRITPLSPQEEARVYVCGITPYDSTHLGHAATYITFDLLNRQLLANGHGLNYVQNVTDVDDPLFERAERDGVDWRELGQSQTDLFRRDMTNLGVIPPNSYIGAVESIPETIELISRLFDADAAYVVDDPDFPDVYARRSATWQFGYESGFDQATMEKLFAKRGGDPDRAGKEDPLDALLWRAARPGEPSWDSPFGPGRPGWHIECAAIAATYLGVPFDVQGGGSDLKFPHHEYSAAHAEAGCGVQRMASHYMHTGLLALGGVKMSKSLGNLVFVSRLCAAGTDPSSIRLALYAGHYRRPRNWSDSLLASGSRRLALWRLAIEKLSGESSGSVDSSSSGLEVELDVIRRVRLALAADLNTPLALDVIDQWALGLVDANEVWQLTGCDGLDASEASCIPHNRNGEPLSVNPSSVWFDSAFDHRDARQDLEKQSPLTQIEGTVIDDGESQESDEQSVQVAAATAGTARSDVSRHAPGELGVDFLPQPHADLESGDQAYSHLGDRARVMASAIDALLGVRV